jgi:hypothetical protein
MTKQERITNYRDGIDAEAESEALALRKQRRYTKMKHIHRSISYNKVRFDKLFRK